MDILSNDKRWLVTLVASNKVVAPVLQDIVKQGMDKLYVTLDNYLRGLTPPCSLQTLTYADVCRLAAPPNLASSLKDLNFGNINNNFVDHGKSKGVYNYNVSSPVDLAKLYLPHYLVVFSAFDKSMDLSAALRLLGCRKYPIQVFVSTDRLHNIQSLADDVRENVRNRGGHFKESDWTQIMFDQCFDKLKALLQYLPLLPDKKKEVLNELSAWKTEGFKRIVDNDVKDLMEKFQDVKLASINEKLDDIPTKEENERAMKKLFSFHTSMMDRFDRMESRMESLIRQVNRKLEGISVSALNQESSKNVHSTESSVLSTDATSAGTCQIRKKDKNPESTCKLRAKIAKLSRRTLHKATINGGHDLVKILLESGEDVNQMDEFGLTPLHLAAWYGKRAVVELLLQHGANVNAVDRFQKTPLQKAERNNHQSIVELLLRNNASPSYNQPFAVGDCPENFYWDGKECSACSGCPRGFGLKKSCTKTKNTECQKCYPGYDYSNSTGMEECIKCDTFSNCLPGRSKKVQECTIFSGPICDGCEEGYYHNPVVGCEKCSPGCDARTEDEIQACTTKHNRNCAPKRVRPKTPTVSNDSKGRGHPNITGNDEDGEIPPVRPEPVGSKSTQAPEENLIVLNPWLWVPLGIVLLVVVTVPIAFFKRKSRVNRRTRVEGDVHTYNTGQHIALQEQKTPLITEGSVDVQNGRDISSLAEQGDPFEPSHELDADPEGVVLDAPKPSSEELSRQAGLDRPIKDLTIKEKTPIITDLSGKDWQGYFYWQRVAEELGFQQKSRGWEGVQNPVENLLKTFGEREGSTIRGLIEATRRAGLTLFASQWEEKFDTSSRDETTVSVHLPLVQGKTNDKFTSVDIPPDPGKENGANESVLLTPYKGKINDKADSDINVPADTGEETAEKDIADTAV